MKRALWCFIITALLTGCYDLGEMQYADARARCLGQPGRVFADTSHVTYFEKPAVWHAQKPFVCLEVKSRVKK